MTSVARPKHPSFSPDGTVRIPLGRGRVALIDAADYPLVSDYRWHATFRENRCYAIAHIPGTGHDGRKILLHRLIMDAKRGDIVDHISGDCCDNRRANLRMATGTQNNANVPKHLGSTSRYKGVSQEQRCFRWVATIQSQRCHCHLGTFATEQEAARAYDRAAIALWDDFALTNFPVQDYAEDDIAATKAFLAEKMRNRSR